MPHNPIVQDLLQQHQTQSHTEINQRNNAAGILSPDDMAGDYEAAIRKLTTTIDGQHRAITYDDLKRFKSHIASLKGALTKSGHKGGISAQTVINLSLPADRERAHTEIKTALPVRKDGTGLLIFRTNASSQSSSSHHLVHVKFLEFATIVSTALKTDNHKLIKQLITGKIKFDCDCGRHRYWYRFIASTGGFNEGRTETGYPKVRNPKLKGIACKHVLRVMTLIIQSPSFKAFAKQWINSYRSDASPHGTDQSNQAIEQFVQSAKAESWRQRQVAAKPAQSKPKSKIPVEVSRQAKALAQVQLSATDKRNYLANMQLLLKQGLIAPETYDIAVRQYA